jgi:molybdenum storage protein
MNDKLVASDGRTHLDTPLRGASLVAPRLVDSTHIADEVAMLPNVNVIGLGGRSVFDRGREIVYPLVETLVEARRRHELVVGCGGGERLRHVFAVGMDLGLPTGGLAQLAGACEEQNAVLLQTLLARHGGVNLVRDHVADLPLYLGQGSIPIVICVPPYHHWEPPSREGRLPEHGSDLGLLMTAEALGARSLILVKDQPGLFTDDPRLVPNAEFIPHVTTGTLLERRLPHLIVDFTLVETLHRTRFLTKAQIVDARKPEQLLAALDGEPVGTIIEQGAAQ